MLHDDYLLVTWYSYTNFVSSLLHFPSAFFPKEDTQWNKNKKYFILYF